MAWYASAGHGAVPVTGPDGSPNPFMLAQPPCLAAAPWPPLPWPMPWPTPWACPDVMANLDPSVQVLAMDNAALHGIHGHGATIGVGPPAVNLQKAMEAAQTATNAVGTGCVPVAARQVASGLWCVLVSESGNALDPEQMAQHLQVESVSVAEPAAFSAPTMNLSLAEHLEPIPEAESPPRTPPTKGASNEVFPTPSPVSYPGVRQTESEIPETKRSEEMAQPPEPETIGAHWNGFAGHKALVDPETPMAVQTEVEDVAIWPQEVQDFTWESSRWRSWNEKKPRRERSRNKIYWTNEWSWDEHVKSVPQAAPRKDRRQKRWERESPKAIQDTDQVFQDDEGGLLGKTVWYLIEEVLIQRPQLEQGKRVAVPFPQWIQSLPLSSSRRNGRDEQRSLVNRAMRNMSKKLPGCCWTVDMQAQEMQVHLADVSRFSRFCDGM